MLWVTVRIGICRTGMFFHQDRTGTFLHCFHNGYSMVKPFKHWKDANLFLRKVRGCARPTKTLKVFGHQTPIFLGQLPGWRSPFSPFEQCMPYAAVPQGHQDAKDSRSGADRMDWWSRPLTALFLILLTCTSVLDKCKRVGECRIKTSTL